MGIIESSILWMVLGAVVTGTVGYLFNRKSKKDDDERDLEKRVSKLEASQRDLDNLVKSQESLVVEVRQLTNSLSNLRIEIAHNERDYYKRIQGKDNG